MEEVYVVNVYYPLAGKNSHLVHDSTTVFKTRKAAEKFQESFWLKEGHEWLFENYRGNALEFEVLPVLYQVALKKATIERGLPLSSAEKISLTRTDDELRLWRFCTSDKELEKKISFLDKVRVKEDDLILAYPETWWTLTYISLTKQKVEE